MARSTPRCASLMTSRCVWRASRAVSPGPLAMKRTAPSGCSPSRGVRRRKNARISSGRSARTHILKKGRRRRAAAGPSMPSRKSRQGGSPRRPVRYSSATFMPPSHAMTSSTRSTLRWLRNGKSPRRIGWKRRTSAPAARRGPQKDSGVVHEPQASTRTITRTPRSAAAARRSRYSRPVSSAAKKYISRKMLERARSIASNMAAKAAAAVAHEAQTVHRGCPIPPSPAVHHDALERRDRRRARRVTSSSCWTPGASGADRAPLIPCRPPTMVTGPRAGSRPERTSKPLRSLRTAPSSTPA